ncbi:YitT family protein [Terrilactibacillus sp. BCM23-1]|uniref:YitT family protein n=1 Tax=Terrilactibacillus tamarindi TaxID=2599694 RepID=A0A6N8CR30_9BACI|nr:YitT family protein [Terrilactibacillus tamarindi]MTT32624.1 YitT family protein [Terrilactibacillus tamarindi]
MSYLSKKYILIFIGAVIQGFSMGVFLFPNAIPTGGAAGITVLLNYWIHVPLSLTLWILNSSVLLFAYQYLGGGYVVGTLFGITVTSVSIDVFGKFLDTPFSNVWIDMFVGSIFFGIGITCLLRQGVSNGGIGVIAYIISRYRHIDPGKPMFWINGFIFVITAYVIDWQIVIQAILCQWISSKIINWLYNLSVEVKAPSLAWRKK